MRAVRAVIDAIVDRTRALFPELRAADPSEGAKPVVRAHASPEGDLDIADEGAFTDIDTVADYERIAGTTDIRNSGGR
ncbi:MAG: hypothetical protein A3F69_00840 [Acidobacteria bacterium RIFCSPLOWO2_12_FULL_66_10]|nr:MAG: hypothetical protein A3F69_00840 [Acidobacteria bacterium RIFCSPLOWO2_12_FULL_66_10]